MSYTNGLDDPSAYFQTALYTGNGGSHTITNDGNSDLQPDWLWIKARNSAQNHQLHDSSRGADKGLNSNNTNAEYTDANAVTGFTSDGFTMNNSYGSHNSGSNTYVAWQWAANGGSRTTFTESGANPGGGYQANTTAGFSIVDYTGTGTNGGTVAHGLGATPTIAIIKDRDTDGTNWIVVYTIQDGSSDRLYLQGTNAKFDLSGTEFRADFDSSNITLGTWNNINADGKKFIAYVFTPIQGYSKFGSYTGNGNADGPFIYTGFKPAWVMWKRTDAESWIILDSDRNNFNVMDNYLVPNSSGAEGSADFLDFTSNGIKIRNTFTSSNNSGSNFIYMCFASSPFVGSDGTPTTAR